MILNRKNVYDYKAVFYRNGELVVIEGAVGWRDTELELETKGKHKSACIWQEKGWGLTFMVGCGGPNRPYLMHLAGVRDR